MSKRSAIRSIILRAAKASAVRIGTDGSTSTITALSKSTLYFVEQAKNAAPPSAPVHRAAGSTGEMHLGTSSVDAPKAFVHSLEHMAFTNSPSSVSRYSSTTRVVRSGGRPSLLSMPRVWFAFAPLLADLAVPNRLTRCPAAHAKHVREGAMDQAGIDAKALAPNQALIEASL